MTIIVTGFYPGPDDTHFAQGQDIPEGFERRKSTAGQFISAGSPIPGAWYQVRPARKPLHSLAAYPDGERIVLVKELRDRDDLGEYEYLTFVGVWLPLLPEVVGRRDDDVPMRIRPKRSSR